MARVTVNDDGWTEIADGDDTGIVQRITGDVIEIELAADNPGSGVSEIGVRLWGGATWIALPGNKTGMKWWARSKSGAAELAVLV